METSEYFINYMNESLKKYENNLNVWSINGMESKKILVNFQTHTDTIHILLTGLHRTGGVLGLTGGQKQFGRIIKLKKEIFKFNNYRNFLKGGRDLSDILIQQLNQKMILGG